MARLNGGLLVVLAIRATAKRAEGRYSWEQAKCMLAARADDRGIREPTYRPTISAEVHATAAVLRARARSGRPPRPRAVRGTRGEDFGEDVRKRPATGRPLKRGTDRVAVCGDAETPYGSSVARTSRRVVASLVRDTTSRRLSQVSSRIVRDTYVALRCRGAKLGLVADRLRHVARVS